MAKKSSFANKSYADIMMEQATKQAYSPVYCRYCGKDVRRPSTKQPETNWDQNIEWEQKYQAHTSCHQSHTVNQRRDMRR